MVCVYIVLLVLEVEAVLFHSTYLSSHDVGNVTAQQVSAGLHILEATTQNVVITVITMKILKNEIFHRANFLLNSSFDENFHCRRELRPETGNMQM